MKIKEAAFLSVKSKLLTKIFKIVTMWLMMYCCYLLRISLGFDSHSPYSCYSFPFGIVCFCFAVLDGVRDCNVENCRVFYITKHVCVFSRAGETSVTVFRGDWEMPRPLLENCDPNSTLGCWKVSVILGLASFMCFQEIISMLPWPFWSDDQHHSSRSLIRRW